MKINLFIVIIILTQIQINAQELSLNFDVGYGFKIVPESSAESYNLTENVAEYKAFTYSYGKGLNLNLEIEYTPKEEYLGFGLGLGYLKSSKVNYSYSGGVYGLVNNIQLKGSMFRLSPFIKLKFKCFLNCGSWHITMIQLPL